MLHFLISLMNRLNKTESAIFISYSWFGYSQIEGSTFYQNFNIQKTDKLEGKYNQSCVKDHLPIKTIL